MFELLKTQWGKERVEMRDAPFSFVICLIIGVVCGAVGVFLLYNYIVIPSKDAQISLHKETINSLKAKVDDLQIALHQNDSENALKTKQKIRVFLKSFNPEVLQKIDAGEKEIPILSTKETMMKLMDLSTYPNFNNFLSFQEYPAKPNTFGGYDTQVEIPGFIKELNPKNWLYKYRISLKGDALREKGN
jgi:hypothetical protein